MYTMISFNNNSQLKNQLKAKNLINSEKQNKYNKTNKEKYKIKCLNWKYEIYIKTLLAKNKNSGGPLK